MNREEVNPFEIKILHERFSVTHIVEDYNILVATGGKAFGLVRSLVG